VQIIISTIKHDTRVAAHNWLGLKVEVTEHAIGCPTTEQLDAIPVDVGIKEGHGTACSEGAGADIGGKEAVGGTMDRGGSLEELSDFGGCHFTPTIASTIGSKRGVWGGVM